MRRRIWRSLWRLSILLSVIALVLVTAAATRYAVLYDGTYIQRVDRWTGHVEIFASDGHWNRRGG